MRFPVFDLHCDTATELAGFFSGTVTPLRRNRFQIDLERAGKLAGFGQCFAFWNEPGLTEQTGIPVQTLFQRALDHFLLQLEQNQDLICQVRTGAEAQCNLERGMQSAILTLEGTAAIEYDPDRLETLARLGFRMSTLTWNESNPLAGSHLTGEGLTDQGKAYVRTAQELGILIDVSHLSDRAFWDIMDLTQAPIVASHSNSRAVWNVSRNLTDDMFRAICQTGGVVGLNLFTGFLGAGRVSMEQTCGHILHWLELDPEGTHLALGGDLDGCDTVPKGFSGVQDYDRLAQTLLALGVGETLVRRIFWENAIGVMNQCCM